MNVRQVIPPDAIPSIDDPVFGPDYVGDDGDEVIVLDDTRSARAYPVRILNYHEIVNDVVERDGRETPVAVTWCPLCGSAIVYDRVVRDRTLTFGVSGKLADDDLVMYDRETESEWKQSLGRAIAGDLDGETLTVLPATVTTYERFRERSPDGVVLQPARTKSEAASDTDEPAPVDYAMEPYDAYFEAEGFGLAAHRGTGGRTWNRTDDIEAKTVVLGIESSDVALGFPRPWVEAAGGVVTVTVGALDAVVFATDDGIHAFENPGFEFAPTTDGFVADGVRWNGATGESTDGRRLDRVPARRLFAFTWQDDHGPDAFFEPSTG